MGLYKVDYLVKKSDELLLEKVPKKDKLMQYVFRTRNYATARKRANERCDEVRKELRFSAGIEDVFFKIDKLIG